MEKLIGWLSPEGVLYKAESHNHYQIAMQIINSKHLIINKKMSVDDQLCKMGWIRLSEFTAQGKNKNGEIVRGLDSIDLSNEQNKWLEENIDKLDINTLHEG